MTCLWVRSQLCNQIHPLPLIWALTGGPALLQHTDCSDQMFWASPSTVCQLCDVVPSSEIIRCSSFLCFGPSGSPSNQTACYWSTAQTCLITKVKFDLSGAAGRLSGSGSDPPSSGTFWFSVSLTVFVLGFLSLSPTCRCRKWVCYISTYMLYEHLVFDLLWTQS